jgi:hypothetical protein
VILTALVFPDRAFAPAKDFRGSLVFEDEARSLHLEWPKIGRHDTQHNDAWLNDIQHHNK